ncbi:threonine/homoserine/homoserine lactone efflux protein [Paraburkholderia sp. JPY419]
MSFVTLSALPAGILFALVTSITPGPNNTMLLASGVNFGFRRTLPHLSGISVGVVLLMLSVGVGLGEAFVHFPVLYTVLEVVSVAYLLYLAWKIGTSGELKLRNGERRPMRFHEAIAFQWVNPKAWMMVLTAATTIHLSNSFGMNAVAMAAVFLCDRLSVHLRVGWFRHGDARGAVEPETAAHLQRRDGAAARGIVVSDRAEAVRARRLSVRRAAASTMPPARPSR